MTHIVDIRALEILDSRGNPTLKVMVKANTGVIGYACVPSGASTGEHEAIELRDGDPKRYFGKGVLRAIASVENILAKALIGKSIFAQRANDELMIELDGTPNKANLGANAILGVSLAIARAAATSMQTPLYRYLGGEDSRLLPCPMFNIINGGAHADNPLDFQEFMVRPVGAANFSEAMRWGCEIFHNLKTMLQKRGLTVSVGDEGGFAPHISDNKATLDLIVQAIEKSGLSAGSQVSIALDCAASEFFDNKSFLYLEKKKRKAGDKTALKRSTDEQIEYLLELCAQYPISSIEDPLDQNDWEGWKKLTDKLGNLVQIVGDDIFVTNLKFLRRGIEEKAANAILIKLNQIGTLSETIDAIEMAKEHGFGTIISHRSGETEDPFIADLAVAFSCGQIKSGSLSRSDRLAKYNRLLEIAMELGDCATYSIYQK